MQLTEKQAKFLQRRRPLVKVFPWIAGLLLALLAILVVVLVTSSPLVFNPMYVAERLKAGTICQSTMQLMAVMLPIMTITCLFAVAGLVAVMISALGHERTYLQIIERLEED